MPHIRHLTAANYRDMPWKNGGGTTCELFRLPHPAQTDGFALRLSIARVASGGPFSRFPGIERTLMLLEGAGMLLEMDGKQIRMAQPLVPIQFAGEMPVQCDLIDGPLCDFNVMVARDWGQAQTEILRLTAGQLYHLPDQGLRLLYIHYGMVTVGEISASAGELLHIPQGFTATITAEHDSQIILAQATPV